MEKVKVLFMGRKTVAAKSLMWLLNQDKIEVVGILTDHHLQDSCCGEIADRYNIEKLEYNDALERINNGSLSFDLGLSMLYWRKLKEGFVSSGRMKTINFHPAPLPEYKGTAGYNLAILEGLSKWSVTAHYVDNSIDTGKIIKLSTYPICKHTETAKSLEKISQDYLYSLFIEVVTETIQANGIVPNSPNVGGRYVSRQEMEDMKEIKEGDDIDRKIRAFWFPPYTGAYIKINGKKYTLVNEELLESLSDSQVSKVF